MNEPNFYQVLNLTDGAGETEIKAAFRQIAKRHHPDSGQEEADSRKFQKAFQAYRHLLAKARAHNQLPPPGSLTPFRLKGLTQRGLDLYYDLGLPGRGSDFLLVIPRMVNEVCPRCFGQGLTLYQFPEENTYRPDRCSRCEGTGRISRLSYLELMVSEDMAEAGRIRLKTMGAFDPQQGRRGDLYITLTFFDSPFPDGTDGV
jgi:DnaJ-class molecular chaperone